MQLLDPATLLTVLLVFVRVGGVLVAAPFFRQPFLPAPVKVFVAVLLAFSLAGFVGGAPGGGGLPPGVTEPLGLALALGVEALTGLLLGFAAQFPFFAVGFAGDVMGFQMSLSLAQVYNPIEGESANPLGRMLSLAFLLLFLFLDGPHHLVRALALSFEVVPLAGADLAAGGPLLLEWMGAFFATALRLAAPFMVTLLLIDVALGVFARLVPQADLFSLGFPIKLLVGLALFALFVEAFGPVAVDLVGRSLDDLVRMVEAIAP
ncbi:MAG: flagellar biosynthetic protein FliR [Rhodothermales bacterium]|nr:flagellar biosynthetic protein FliR [Rhodothermales bacterium]